MPTKTIFFYFLQLIALLNAVLFVGLNYESNTHYLIIISYAVFMLIAVLSVRYAPKYFFGIPLLPERAGIKAIILSIFELLY